MKKITTAERIAARERVRFLNNFSNIEKKRKEQGLPPLKFGEKPRSIIVPASQRDESIKMIKEKKKEIQKIDRALWENNKQKGGQNNGTKTA